MDTGETLDHLLSGQLQLWQAKGGHRYSIDAILLARFVRLTGTCRRIADLGTGNGVLPLLLAVLGGAETIVGFELQEAMAVRARRNVELNGLTDRINICQGDIRGIKDLHDGGAMDLVVSNPPYRSVASGRLAPDGERAQARHELAGTIADFALAAVWLLKPGGRFAVVYLAERLIPLLCAMTGAGIEPKRVRMVQAGAARDARLVLVEGVKGGRSGLKVEPALVLYKDLHAGRCYTDEVEQMYRLEKGKGC